MLDRHVVKTAIIAAALPLLMAGNALGGEGIEVRVTNDGTADLMVTVYDLNTRPRRVLLENARINGFTSVPINAVGDATGRAQLGWTATSIDRDEPRCGHEDATRLGDASSLRVHADSSCST